jgi:hypothetical protein
VTFLIVILSVALFALVVFVLSAPVRAARRSPEHGWGVDGAQQSEAEVDRAASAAASAASTAGEDLEAAREAKYREIRDSELDYRTGKLSRDDYEAINSGLRAEAIEILNRLDELNPNDEELGADGEVDPVEEASQAEGEMSVADEAPESDDEDDTRGEVDLRPTAEKLRPRDA